MKSLLTGVALLAAFGGPVAAETRYDVKLEKAVMEIVARKIGDIRGGFSFERAPVFVMPQSAAAGWKVSASIIQQTDPMKTGSLAQQSRADKDDAVLRPMRPASRVILF
jgi:hypothetical protein